MNHKRKRPKHQRSGCLMCKSHKDERMKKKPRSKKALDIKERAQRMIDEETSDEIMKDDDFMRAELAWCDWE